MIPRPLAARRMSFLVLIISFILRYVNFEKVPFPGESMDEYSYTWVGMSVIKSGVPIGISGVGGYRNEVSKYINVDNVYQTTANGNPQTINWPWFDHPPLLGLITGGFALSKGVTNFYSTNIYIIRKPMLILGVISVLLVIVFSWLNFGYLTGLITGLIYGTMPVVVVGSRMIQGENWVIPSYLASMIAISLFIKTKNTKWVILSGIFAGVSCLFKISGLTSILAISFWLYLVRNQFHDEWQTVIIEFLTVSLSTFSLFFIYGFAIDWNQFISILKSNSNRVYGIGPEALFNLITQVKITNIKHMADPSVIMGWICFFGLLFKSTNNVGDKLFLKMGVFWIMTYIFLGSYSHGWYAFPFYPILAISLARLWCLSWKNLKYLTIIVLLWIVGIGTYVSRLINIDMFQQYSNLWRILISGLLLFSLKNLNNRYKSILNRFVLLILFGTILYINIYYIRLLTVDYWYKVF